MEMKMFYDHVQQIAKDHEIVVVMDRLLLPNEAAAIPQIRMVVLHGVFEETTYMVAMHELGHIIAEGGSADVSEDLPPVEYVCRKMECEDAAWGWARANALVWTDVMERWADWARETYRQRVVTAVKARYIRHAPGRPVWEG